MITWHCIGKRHWRGERENEGEEEIFPGLGLAWDVVVEVTRANKDPYTRSLRTFRRSAATTRQEEDSSGSSLVGVRSN